MRHASQSVTQTRPESYDLLAIFCHIKMRIVIKHFIFLATDRANEIAMSFGAPQFSTAS